MIQKSKCSKSKSRRRFANWLAKARTAMKQSLSKGKSKLNNLSKDEQLKNDREFRGFSLKNKVK